MRFRAPKFIQIALALVAFVSVFQMQAQQGPVPAIYDTAAYLTLLEGKSVGVVANQTSLRDGVHLVDYLLSKDISIKKVFAPEHGFRGKADAGEKVEDGKDAKTGLPIISLYGKNKKPSQEMLEGLDLIIFDIQDVGVRFYTYISTLSYVMEAAAEKGIPVIVLDRPNPNGHYVDGPILEPDFTSFVGLHPVPIVYGMTIGEYGKMVNGEGWLKDGIVCDYTVIKCMVYDHTMHYELPIKPSPNLPNARSIQLYPSLCFFEGTTVSVGRGTDFPFQVYGAPYFKVGSFEFTPVPNEGAKNPKHNGKVCKGFDMRVATSSEKANQINISLLRMAYLNSGKPDDFFNNFFDKLAGTDKLRLAILNGASMHELSEIIHNVDSFKSIRKKYLLYPDFE